MPPYLVPLPQSYEASSPWTITSAPKPARVLLVDDNVDAADTLAELLDACGYLCHVAYDGPSALEAARQFQPSVAILDIGLPGMDGYELYAEPSPSSCSRELTSCHGANRLTSRAAALSYLRRRCRYSGETTCV